MPAAPLRRVRLVREGQENDLDAMKSDTGLKSLRATVEGVLARDLAEPQQIADAVAQAVRSGDVISEDGDPWYEWVYDPAREEWVHICHQELVMRIVDGDGRPALLTIEDERNLGT